jgi:anti-anti-sigma factor
MNITSESHLAAMVFSITGDLTADEVDCFKRTIKEALVEGSSNAILDCSDLDHIDSAGLEALLWLTDELNQRECKLRLACVTQTVIRAFEITRLERVFNTNETVEAAARSFG